MCYDCYERTFNNKCSRLQENLECQQYPRFQPQPTMQTVLLPAINLFDSAQIRRTKNTPRVARRSASMCVMNNKFRVICFHRKSIPEIATQGYTALIVDSKLCAGGEEIINRSITIAFVVENRNLCVSPFTLLILFLSLRQSIISQCLSKQGFQMHTINADTLCKKLTNRKTTPHEDTVSVRRPFLRMRFKRLLLSSGVVQCAQKSCTRCYHPYC